MIYNPSSFVQTPFPKIALSRDIYHGIERQMLSSHVVVVLSCCLTAIDDGNDGEDDGMVMVR